MGVGVGPLRLADIAPPELPGPGWHRVTPRLAGICGSDLSTLEGHGSRYFEDVVSFPFVPGHEVVGDLDEGLHRSGRRVVIQPALGCLSRNVAPPCNACAHGQVGACERVAFGELEPGLQTGYCASTGGGWSGGLVAHDSQILPVPESMSDEAAVMVEPTACAVHAALSAQLTPGDCVVVLGSGTLGLCTVAALRALTLPGTVMVSARYPEQRNLAAELGADVALEPGELARAVRRHTRSFSTRHQLTGGADVVIDCAGNADSIQHGLAVVRPRGRVVLLGMPGRVNLDLASLWHREVSLVGSYAYGMEQVGGQSTSTFDLALDLVASARLDRLLSARYPLERFEEAISHAAGAGRRGSVKVAFDPKAPSPRPAPRRRRIR